MFKDIQMAFMIVLLSGAAALGTNALRTERRMALIPEIKQPPPPPPPASQPAEQPENGQAPEPAKADPFWATMDEVLNAVRDGTPRLIDARQAPIYADGHLRGAINLPSDQAYAMLEGVTKQVASSEPIIVYCGGGDCSESAEIADVLRTAGGYTQVRIYHNGWEEVMSSGRFADCVMQGETP